MHDRSLGPMRPGDGAISHPWFLGSPIWFPGSLFRPAVRLDRLETIGEGRQDGEWCGWMEREGQRKKGERERKKERERGREKDTEINSEK